MGDVQDLIKIVNPSLYATGEEKAIKKYKNLLSKAEDGKEIFKLLSENKDDEEIKSVKSKSLSSYKLVYDAQTNQVEPVYYWLLDFVNENFSTDVVKLTDNFMATPGSGGFDEYGRKLGTVQEKASTYLGAINQVTKSILQLIYDLKEFELRLTHYEDAKSKEVNKKEAGMLALKQVWLDNVDAKRQTGSIHQMSYQVGYTTLRELFMISNSVEEVKKNEFANDQVKRVLIPRIQEFLDWTIHSEKELTKRFEIEKSYLRTQVETLKLYTSWVRPYLRSAEQLRQKGFEKNPAMVNAFSTSMFELTFMAKKKTGLSKPFEDKKLFRDYYSILLISMTYRGHYSQRVSQRGDMAYGFGGRVDITFDSYALNSEELKLFEKLRDLQDRAIGLSFVQEESEKSLEQLQQDIDHFLKEGKEEKKEQKRKGDDINPFTALFGIFSSGMFSSSKKEKKEIKAIKDIKSDDYVEKYARKAAEEFAKKLLYVTYDVYKKAHMMASSPDEFDS